jgi:hypothetical protein
VLELAREHGWEPAGTKPPEWTVYAPDGVSVDELRTRVERQRYANWGGGYFWNNYQVVCDEDAANIADALERALDDVPNEGAEGAFLIAAAQYQAAQRDELWQEDLLRPDKSGAVLAQLGLPPGSGRARALPAARRREGHSHGKGEGRGAQVYGNDGSFTVFPYDDEALVRRGEIVPALR